MAKKSFDVSYNTRLIACGEKMILPITNRNNNLNFSANNNTEENKLPYTHDTVLKNTFSNRVRIGVDKLTNAMTVYPAKGLKGSKNANFYEFLTMGTVPYLVGSGMLMAIFNSNKTFMPFDKGNAKSLGRRLALGVLFYGVAKNLSKFLVTQPVKWMTGVDTEQPYAKVQYELPENINDTDITSIEYHKVPESCEFIRWDLMYGKEDNAKTRNEPYDKIAKKLGMGENLNDSDQEAKPRIKEIVIKSATAKNITSYLWAAIGVGVAIQECWDKFFNVATLKFWQGKKFAKSSGTFVKTLGESIKSFYKGDKHGPGKYAGKLLFGAAALATIASVSNVMMSDNKPSKLDSADIIEKSRKYVVN